MKEQLKNLRISFDWHSEIATHKEDYYKWTQWIFIEMYKKGLAYSMKVGEKCLDIIEVLPAANQSSCNNQ